MPAKRDLTNRVFGRLTVLGEADRHPKFGTIQWRCRCVCGRQTLVCTGRLNNGNTTSCGCLRLERSIAARKTHGETFGGKPSPEYYVWQAMLRRCHTTSHKMYPLYGGRGITVCDRWRESFLNFLEDMGRRPSPSLELDRIDNDAGYCKENCRWTTRRVQVNNRRNSIVVEFRGERRNLIEWSGLLGINARTLYNRWKRGMRTPELFANSVPRGRKATVRK